MKNKESINLIKHLLDTHTKINPLIKTYYLNRIAKSTKYIPDLIRKLLSRSKETCRIEIFSIIESWHYFNSNYKPIDWNRESFAGKLKHIVENSERFNLSPHVFPSGGVCSSLKMNVGKYCTGEKAISKKLKLIDFLCVKSCKSELTNSKCKKNSTYKGIIVSNSRILINEQIYKKENFIQIKNIVNL